MVTRLGRRRPQFSRLRYDALEPRETPAVTVIDFGTGFTPSRLPGGLTVGYADGDLLLTDGPYQTRAVFAPTRVDVRAFQTSFVFHQTGGPGPIGDGLTFAVAGSNVLFFGTAGGGLGYQGLTNSVAIKIDLVDNAGEGTDSVGLYTGGAAPTTPAVSLAGTGIDLHSGHPFRADLAYDGVELTLTLTDTTAPDHTWTHEFVVDVPAAVGSSTGYAGFTAGTGLLFAQQAIESWTYAEDTPAPGVNRPPTITAPARVILETPTEVTLGGGAVDDGLAANLTYSWTVVSTPAGASPQVTPITSPDYPAAARVTLDRTGAYTFLLTARDAHGLIATSPVTYVLAPKVTNLDVGPPSATVPAGAAVPFVAVPLDQFGMPMTLPGPVAWQVVSGPGAIDSAGVYTAPAAETGMAVIRGVVPTGHPLITDEATVTVVSASTSAGGGLDFRPGFDGADLARNGSAQVTDGRLRLADGPYQAGSAYAPVPVDVRGFTATFRLRFGDSAGARAGDGLTFVLQNASPAALGVAGGGLGYQGIGQSVAIKFDLVDNAGERPNSVGVYTGGAAPTFPADPLPDGQWDAMRLNNGRTYDVRLRYGGGALMLDLRDSVTWQQFNKTYAVDIPAAVGGPTAYTGFTAGTGELFAPIDVLDWTYTPTTDTSGNPAPLITGVVTPSFVRGTTADLSAMAADDGPAADLTYRWEVETAPAGVAPVRFSANGVNAAQATTATFDAAGQYTFRVVVTDAAGNSTRSDAHSLEVVPTLSAFVVTPAAPTVLNGAAVAVAVEALDQFGDPMPFGSGHWDLTLNGPGYFDHNSNKYVARPTGTGPVTIRASNGPVTGTATVTVVDHPSATSPDTETFPGLVASGSAIRDWDGRTYLTLNGPNVAGSLFTATPVNVTGFAARLSLRLAGYGSFAGNQGAAFVVQGVGPNAVGAAGAGLGYQGIGQSAAVTFDSVNNTIGFATNGAAPAGTVPLHGTGIDLRSAFGLRGDLFYDGTTLHVRLTDPNTQATAAAAFAVDLPAFVGGNTAYMGFTGSTGPTVDPYAFQSAGWEYRFVPPGAPNQPPVIVRPARLLAPSYTPPWVQPWADFLVRAADDGPFDLRYRWEVVSAPAGAAPQFNPDGQTGVRFDRPGTYVFRVTATDAQGLSATSDATYLVP
ncbi:MAG TPA: PKD domain-containing protein [Gemmataceae bacterium]|nr:PKD domain-containing protein [Gemmataceae bacterium]